MSNKIKLCQELRSNVCAANKFDLKPLKDLIYILENESNNSSSIRKKNKPSPFLELIITSLTALCDNLHLTGYVITNHKFRGRNWYEFIGRESMTSRKIKKFLLDAYHDESLASRMEGSRSGYTSATLTFKDEDEGTKYSVILSHPNPLSEKDKESIIIGIFDGLLAILPNNILNRTMIGIIMLRNLQTILEQPEKTKIE